MSSPSKDATMTETMEEELNYYKSQYEQLEVELADFQASSRELEAELEKDIEASEKRERHLKEKVESLGYEVDEWKVGKRNKTTTVSLVHQVNVSLRPSINKLRQNRTPFRPRYKRKSRHYETQTLLYNSN